MLHDDLIAVVGKMHSGKTTLADGLVDLGYRRFAFADPVKDVSAAMLTTFHNFFEGGEIHLYNRDMINNMKGHPAIRKLLQLVGTELGREWLGPDTLWIDRFEKRINYVREQAMGTRLSIVNDDCRFVNESERLRVLGFTIIKLVRNEDERIESIRNALRKDLPFANKRAINKALKAILTHPSETNVDLITADFIIDSISVHQLQDIIAPQLTQRLALR